LHSPEHRPPLDGGLGKGDWAPGVAADPRVGDAAHAAGRLQAQPRPVWPRGRPTCCG
jgi:hypothetical protein